MIRSVMGSYHGDVTVGVISALLGLVVWSEDRVLGPRGF